jgi:uncharacterized membrane protein YphA (DoxX/SURF4 family)
MTLVRRIARPMLASLFMVQGMEQLRHPSAMHAKVAPFAEKVAPLGLPNDPELLVRANGATMVGAGGLLALGRFPRLASMALVATMAPTTYVGHAFWQETDPVARRQNRTQFLKNVSLIGGLLLASVDTEGRPGLAYRMGMAGNSAKRAARRARRETRHAARTARREAKLATTQVHDALT